MKAKYCLLGLSMAAFAATLSAQAPTRALTVPSTQAPSTVPRATIANRFLRVVLNLPDAQDGYYRGTRFDWSGVIASLQFQGHQYFGQWFPTYNPTTHDSITGPVEEYVTVPDDAGLGYATAKPGDTFVKIGVGILRKSDEARYSFTTHYQIVKLGDWTVKRGADYVSFTQTLNDPDSGYGYHYTKTVRLVPGQPVMKIEHALTNVGKLPIDTAVYNHNMFVIDDTPSGPDMSVSYPFLVRRLPLPDAGPVGGRRPGAGQGSPAAPPPDLMSIQGHDLVYLQELKTGRGQTIHWNLGGFGSSPDDFGATIRNKKTGAGVQISADQALFRAVFWSIRTVLCPELYANFHIAVGQTARWTETYRFFTFPPTVQ